MMKLFFMSILAQTWGYKFGFNVHQDYNVCAVSSDSDWNVGGGVRGVPATRLGLPDNRLLWPGLTPSVTWNDTVAARNITPFVVNAVPKLPRNLTSPMPVCYHILI